MKYNISHFTVTVFTAITLTTLENTFAERAELFDHPLFVHQSRLHNVSRAELPAVVSQKIIETPSQLGWIQWASSYIIGRDKETVPPSPSLTHAELQLASQKSGESWGNWLSQSIGSSIIYANQIMGAVVQTVFATNSEVEQDASDVLPSSFVQPVLEGPAGESAVPNRFDTITYVKGMREVIEQGIGNAKPAIITELLQKDAEVRVRFAGPQERFPDALRKAEWRRALDENYQDVADLRRAKKKAVPRKPLRGSHYSPPVGVHTPAIVVY